MCQLFSFLQIDAASWWRVCYQRGLPHLVLPVLIMYAEKCDYTKLLRTKEKGTIEANEDYGYYGEDYMETEFK